MIIANWKMNMTLAEAKLFLQRFHPKKDCAICAPFTLLQFLHEQKNPHIKIGAQNLFYEQKGAYTGEISPVMIKEFAEYVIIGHSERRKLFHDTEEIVEKKLKAAVSAGLIPILCISSLEQLPSDACDTLYVAYEPVASIGTGNAADPKEINVILKKIRAIVNAKNLVLLYGGSVTSMNAKEYLEQPEINGLLVGGASLNPDELLKIIQAQ
jgi:triosephosphate isomerase